MLFLEKCPQCTLINVYPYLNKTQNMLLSQVKFTLSCYSYFPICRGANLEFKRTSSTLISPQPKIYSLSQTPQPKANTGAGLPPFSLSYFPGSVGLLPTGHIYSNMSIYFTSPIKMMLALWYQVWQIMAGMILWRLFSPISLTLQYIRTVIRGIHLEIPFSLVLVAFLCLWHTMQGIAT